MSTSSSSAHGGSPDSELVSVNTSLANATTPANLEDVLKDLDTVLTTGIAGFKHKGGWDAAANTPALASGVGGSGDLYVVTTSGTTNLDGVNDWGVGDYAWFDANAGIWRKTDNTESTKIMTETFRALGSYAVDTEVDERWYNDTGVTATISKVRLSRGVAGSGGSTTFDVNVNGTTIYTTQANRPSVAAASGDNATSLGGTPDVVSVPDGSYLSVDADEVEAGSPKNAVLTITMIY